MARKRISVKEAVSDIRSGMDDYKLMTKYQLASDGLQSLLDKLVAGGYMEIEHTVDLKEELLSLSQVLKYPGQPVPSNGGKAAELERRKADDTVCDISTDGPQSKKDKGRPSPEQRERGIVVKPIWYESPVFVILLLIAFFPLGFYALYLSSHLSRQLKLVTLAASGLLSLVCVLLVLKLL